MVQGRALQASLRGLQRLFCRAGEHARARQHEVQREAEVLDQDFADVREALQILDGIWTKHVGVNRIDARARAAGAWRRYAECSRGSEVAGTASAENARSNGRRLLNIPTDGSKTRMNAGLSTGLKIRVSVVRFRPS